MTSTITFTADVSILSFLDSIDVENNVVFTFPNGVEGTVTKIDKDIWQDNQSLNTLSSQKFADKVLALPNGVRNTMTMKTGGYVLDTPDKFSSFLKSEGKYGLNTYLLKVIDPSKVPSSQSGHLVNPFPSLELAAHDKNISIISTAIEKIEDSKSLLFSELSQSHKVNSTQIKKRLINLRALLIACGTAQNKGFVDVDDLQVFEPNFSYQFPFSVSSLFNLLKKKVIDNDFEAKWGVPLDGGSKSDYLKIIETCDPDNSWAKYLDNHYTHAVALHYAIGGSYKLGANSLEKIKNSAVIGKYNYDCNAYFIHNSNPLPTYDPNGIGFPEDKISNIVNNEMTRLVQFALSEGFICDENVVMPDLSSWLGHLSKYVTPDLYSRVATVLNSKKNLNSTTLSVIRTLVLSGLWYPKSCNTVEIGSFRVAIDPGMSVYKKTQHWIACIPKFNPTGPVLKVHGSYGCEIEQVFSTDGWDLLVKGSSKITYSDSKTLGKNYSEEEWSHLEDAENSNSVEELDGDQIITVKNTVAELSSKSVSDFSLFVQCLLANFPQYAECILFKDDWGHYDALSEGENNSPWNAFQKKYSEFDHLADPSDIVQVNKFIVGFDKDQVSSATKTLGGINNYQSGDLLGAKFALREALLNWKSKVSKSKELGVYNGVRGVLKPVTSLHLGGMQPKTYFVDPDGNLFMGKPNNNEKFRLDSEYAAYEIGRMFGYNIPDSVIRTIDGQYTHVQKIISDSRDLVGVDYESLSDDLLIQALRIHPFHWAVSNHDLAGDQFLISPSNTVYSIDLGQAWKGLGQDKLQVGWELPGNYGGIWYKNFFNAVQNGEVSADRLNRITRSVLRKAKYISEKRDTEFSYWIDEAFKNRTYYPGTKQEFIELAFKRKKSTFDDFYEFYKNLYADGNYEFDFNVSSFNSTRLEGTDAHLVLDDSFAEQVKKNGIYGKSLFFSNAFVEDSHAFFYTIQRGKGTSVHIEMKLRQEGDSLLCNWLNKVGVKSDNSAPKPPPVIVPSLSDKLPMADDFIAKLVAFAKTVNHHFGDKEYNSGTVNEANSAAVAVNTLYTATKSAAEDYVDPVFHSKHQKDHWLAWAESVIEEFNSVQNAYINKSKAPMVSTSYSYTPPKPQPVAEEKPSVKKISKQYMAHQKTFTTLRSSEASSDGVTVYLGEQVHGSMMSFHISDTLRNDLEIQYVPFWLSGKSSANYSNTGRLQIDILEWNGSSEHLLAAFDFLKQAGIFLAEATETSLQLFFWRHLANVLCDRKLNPKEGSTKAIVEKIPVSGDLEELTALKAAFSTLWGSDTVDNANWHPQFGDFRAHFLEPLEDPEDRIKSGRPHWMRPDFSLKDYYQNCAGVLPCRFDNDSAYLLNGGYMANEEKNKFTGIWAGNRSNSADADRQKGSSQFAFVHQGTFISDGGTGFYIEPQVAGRTHNYAFDGDHFGAVSDRLGGSPFNLVSSARYGAGEHLPGAPEPQDYTGGGDELMIKYGWSTWDDIAIIAVSNNSEKKTLVNFYHSKGITEIRGIKVEDRIVTKRSQAIATMTEIWKIYLNS